MEPKITGYRIISKENNQSKQQKQSPLVKIIFIAPQHYQIKSVVCNQKVYDIPIETTIHNDHLDNISFNQKCEKCCEILSKNIDTIRVSQFIPLKKDMKQYFNIDLDIDSEQLFLIFISDQLQGELNETLDAISDMKIVNLVKMIYDNCPTKLLPKMQRKFKKYLSNSKRSQISIRRLQTLLKLVKQVEQKQDIEQQQQIPSNVVDQKKVEQKPITKENKQQKQKKLNQQSKKQIKQAPKYVNKKQEKTKIIQTQKLQPKKPNRKQRRKKQNQLDNIPPQNQQKNQNDQEDWVDDDGTQQQWEDYTSKKDSSRSQPIKYQKKKENYKPKKSQGNQVQQEEDKSQKQHHYVRKLHKRDEESNNSSLQRENKRQSGEKSWGKRNNKENKNIDLRVLLGINGASEKVWRERMRQYRKPMDKENQSSEDKNFQKNKSKKYQQKGQEVKTRKQQQKQQNQKIVEQVKVNTSYNKSQSTGILTKVYSYPVDKAQGKSFKFEKKNYNIFINNSFWVKIQGNQITISKDNKGYIRNSKIQIIDGGTGLMSQGITLNLDGLSNLQDGGISFGDPNFKDFLPVDGNQWFHIIAMDVYTNQ